ncbi:MAG: hypothetical protein AB7S87_16890 [Burkholderiales bacterium]
MHEEPMHEEHLGASAEGTSSDLLKSESGGVRFADQPLLMRMAAYLRLAYLYPRDAPQHLDQLRDLLVEFDAKQFRSDEPLFVLRGRDSLAAATVQHWAAKAHVAGVNPKKVMGALQLSAAMEKFQGRRLPD